MWKDPRFLCRFFRYFGAGERPQLAMVCTAWRNALYSKASLWADVRPVLHCRQLRVWTDNDPARRDMKQVSM